MKWFLLSLSHLIIFGLGFVVGIIAYPTIIQAESTMMRSEQISTHIPTQKNSQAVINSAIADDSAPSS